jgi:hypothetical protein
MPAQMTLQVYALGNLCVPKCTTISPKIRKSKTRKKKKNITLSQTSFNLFLYFKEWEWLVIHEFLIRTRNVVFVRSHFLDSFPSATSTSTPKFVNRLQN